jgi:hypothetical protein
MRANIIDERDASERRLLIIALRPNVTSADVAETDQILKEPVDWTALVQRTLQHGVTAQVFERLLVVAESEIPPDIAAAAQAHIDHLRVHNRALIAQLLSVFDALKAADIDIIPLKGPLLAHLAYGDAMIRACRDLDFLVRKADVARIDDVLHKLGYRPYPEMPPLTIRQHAAVQALSGQAQLWRPGAPAAIEPHWSLAPSNLCLAIDHDGMWQRSRLITFERREIRGLAPEDLVLAIAVHGGKDEWSKLLTVSDLARAIVSFEKLDWQLVLERAKRQRCLRILLTGMGLVERLMGIALPPAVVAACAGDRDINHLARAAADQMLTRGPTAKSIFELSHNRLRLHDRWWNRVRYAAATMLTPREQHFGLVRLPDRLFFLYYPVKVAHDYILLPIWLLLKRARFVDPTRHNTKTTRQSAS